MQNENEGALVQNVKFQDGVIRSLNLALPNMRSCAKPVPGIDLKLFSSENEYFLFFISL